ncbi:type VI secretion system baseplate subunit TssF [Mucilaginibacter gossypii]|uniref:type VI secretion system baseplate subunit TssF n=1 Tax=Mucilaginibacter gossypii TaxID=551996 RepID=UPI000DCE7E3B|nr:MULTISPECIES: type VI secretion system baseplate subunit TssF [Mucilaginibacter]QTE37141.1 type VI secretion system baseplate subunit TssF [Mucilaginibacter gossypii]RAV59120.1 hypothetical protein DIU36_07795 [Mucilaginibacter rubeus]
MSTIFYNSKEEIRNRMLKNATEFWGVQNVNDVDPLVKLLIEALSTELFNLNNDVKNLEHRILNKISRILASDYLTAPLPAHAILKGNPIEASEILNIGNHFYFRKQLAAEVGKTSPEQLDIYFTPAGATTVFNAEIKYSFNGARLQEHIETEQKNTLVNVRAGAFGEPNTLWIGIETAVALNTFKNAGIYFDWPVYISNTDFYSLLQVTKFYLDGSQLDTEPGLIYADEQADDQKPVFYDQHIINLITRDVRTYYNNHFISLTDERLSNITAFKANYPVELLSFFNEQDLKALKPCLWFKIVFPAAIPANAIDELQLHLNCFPVMSRRLHQQKFRIKEISDIIPIKPGAYDHFLSIHELHDDNDVRYNEIPYSQAGINYEGSYSIRNGGAERFDARNARQTIEYLFELLRDEKAAFAAYGSDFLTTALKTLEQNISVIEKKSKSSKDNHELVNYLVLKPANKAAMLYLSFWTTLADNANNIRKGSKLQQAEAIKLKPDSLRLLTTTTGGRNSLGPSERIQAYKYGLTTKDRIVTLADLTSFCRYELGTKIKNIRVSKGVSISANPKEGFIKTTDIYITPADHELSAPEWATLLELLKSKLQSRSVMDVNYRVFAE